MAADDSSYREAVVTCSRMCLSMHRGMRKTTKIGVRTSSRWFEIKPRNVLNAHSTAAFDKMNELLNVDLVRNILEKT